MSLEEMEKKLKLKEKMLQKIMKIHNAEQKIKNEEYQGKYDRLMTKKNTKKEKLELKGKRKGLIIKARDKEAHLDYEGALKIWEYIGSKKESKRLRQKIIDGKKVEQTVVHGDYVDDRDTIVKDSVINRSSIGAGGDDKFARLEKLTEMKEKGLIDDDEFQQMKKEILGK